MTVFGLSTHRSDPEPPGLRRWALNSRLTKREERMTMNKPVEYNPLPDIPACEGLEGAEVALYGTLTRALNEQRWSEAREVIWMLKELCLV